MITAIAVLLTIQTLGAMPAQGIELVAEVSFPAKSNATYVFGAIPGKDGSDALVFTLSVLGDSSPATFRYDPSSKDVKQINGYLSREQQDCGLGLAVIEPASWDSCQVIDVDSGRVLSKVDARIKRTGILGYEVTETNTGDARLIDVRTGEVIRRISVRPGDDRYIGAPAWDDGSLRLFVKQATKPDGSLTDGQVLFSTRGRTFESEKEVVLFRAALGFDRIIGNPNNTCFAVAFSNNRRVSYNTYTNKLAKTSFQVDHVLDVSDRGVLGRMVTKENEYTDPDLSPVGCWNPHTGTKLWQLQDATISRAIWLKNCALVGSQLLNSTTGEVITDLPPNRVFIAAGGRTIWTLTKGGDQKFEVWRVR